ncbi:MAG: outer membrane lipoprotein-sorting protein [Polyangiaceae bacterium]
MKRITWISNLLVAAGLLVGGGARAAGPSAGEIAKKIRDLNAGYGDLSAKVEMKLENAQGQATTRKLRIRSLEQPDPKVGDYSIVIFDSPRDVRGTALLSHAGVGSADQQWLYLPALKRVKRISSSRKTGAFLGSEFTYEDITGNEAAKYEWKRLGDGKCPASAGKCYQLETRPKDSESGYSRRVIWVEQKSYRIEKIDFFDKANKLQKTLNYEDFKQYKGKYWRAHRWVMKNHQSGKKTVLTFDKFSFGNGFSAGDFSKAALERIK